MRKFLSITIILILVSTLFLFLSPSTEEAISDLTPFTPHGVRVLVVSPQDVYLEGGHYLIADLARYGFNITQQASNDPITTNYLNDPKTSNLDDQYDVVILHGIEGFPPSTVSPEEIAHFTSFKGTLIVIGNAFFENETEKVKSPWWGFDSEPIRIIEQRLGVDFTGFLGEGGAWHNSGRFDLTNNLINGLPLSLSYTTTDYSARNYQIDFTTKGGAISVYNFTITSSPLSRLVGKTTCGMTYFKNSTTGAVGIYIQGSYIYAKSTSNNQINYFGLTDSSKRSTLLASLIAYALEKDINTIIKPQPLANIRLDGVGQYPSQTQTYLNASLSNFDSVLDAYNITPTIGFIDFIDYKPNYWQSVALKVLSQLKGEYRDWEYNTNLRYSTDPRRMTKEQIEALLDNIKGNYSTLGMDLFSTVTAPNGRWNQSTLDAMVSKNLYLLEIMDTDTCYPDWWNLRVNSSVIVHNGAQMLSELSENFTQTGLDSIHYKYFSWRDRFALATLNGFASFVYYVPNFRWNEVGTYSLRTVYENLTSEIPDIHFVPLIEAGLYFGNKWMRIENASRVGAVIEFDVDASAIPNVVNIGKGMLWLRINANESIQEVSIDNNPWFYFDNSSIRIPAPMSSSHVKIILGVSPSPRVVESKYEVVEARYDGYRFTVSISSAHGLNVSVHLFLPQIGPFQNDSWNVVSLEAEWSYDFDPQSRIFEFWAISDETGVTFELGVFWSIEQRPPWYNSSVTITANTTGLQTEIKEGILSYHVSNSWVNATMTLTSGLWSAEIPMMPYGTTVEYKVFISDIVGRWLASGIFRYNVIDETPPWVEVPTWEPLNPTAGQSVSVNVAVTEPENASGVQEVVLWYYLGSDITGLASAKSINMTRENGDTWSAVLPGQSYGALISFFILAYDKSGNVKQTQHYNYNVTATSTTLSLPPLLVQVVIGVGVSVGVGIGAIVYFVKFRKKHT